MINSNNQLLKENFLNNRVEVDLLSNRTVVVLDEEFNIIDLYSQKSASGNSSRLLYINNSLDIEVHPALQKKTESHLGISDAVISKQYYYYSGKISPSNHKYILSNKTTKILPLFRKFLNLVETIEEG